MRDAIVLAMLVLGFATFVTTHLVIVVLLTARHRPRWRGPAAFALPPLGPFWAWQVGRRKLVVLWAAALLIYLTGLLISALSR